jgi:hypothetical protein
MRKPRRIWALLVGAVGIGAVIFVVPTAGSSPPQGDPGNKVLHELHAVVVSAIPSEVSGVSIADHWTYHHGKCPDNPSGSAGWFAVRVQATLSTPKSESAIANAMSIRLQRSGWSRKNVREEVYVSGKNFPVKMRLPVWTKASPTKTGSAWSLTLSPDNSAANMWAVEADWDPPGYSLPGC